MASNAASCGSSLFSCARDCPILLLRHDIYHMLLQWSFLCLYEKPIRQTWSRSILERLHHRSSPCYPSYRPCFSSINFGNVCCHIYWQNQRIKLAGLRQSSLVIAIWSCGSHASNWRQSFSVLASSCLHMALWCATSNVLLLALR